MTRGLLRPLLVIGAVVGAAFGYVRLLEDGGDALNPGTEAPAFRLPSLAGGEVDLVSLRGRLVVLNFWATWCPPCVAEMPSLERLHRALGKEGIQVLGVSIDEDGTALRRFVADHGVTFPILRDPGGRVAARTYRTTGYPATFVIDPGGRLKEHYVGPAVWDTPEALAHFRRLRSPIYVGSVCGVGLRAGFSPLFKAGNVKGDQPIRPSVVARNSRR